MTRPNPKTKTSISYDEDLDDIITSQVDAGINDSVSGWFQEAAYLRLALQGLSREAQGAKIADIDVGSAESFVDADLDN
jgi:hypothetical protein